MRAGRAAERIRWRAVDTPSTAMQPSTRITGNVVSSSSLRVSLAAMWSLFAFEPRGEVVISEAIG
jgi:hypothetical protein